MQPTQPSTPQPPQVPPATPPPMMPMYPNYPPPHQPPAPRPHLATIWIVLIVFAAVIGLCGSFSLGYAVGVTPVRATPTSGTIGQQQVVGQVSPSTRDTPIPTPKNIVFQVSGNGSKTTESFTVRGTWRLQWSCSSGFLGVMIYDAKTNDYAPLDGPDYQCPSDGGTDSSTYHQGGTFYLDITSGADYTISVIDLSN